MRWTRCRTPWCGCSVIAIVLRKNGPRCSGASCAAASSTCSGGAAFRLKFWAPNERADDEGSIDWLDPGIGPAGEQQQQEAYQRLVEALRTLPARQREAFTLRVLEDLDVATTAKAMGCSEGSVKTHLSRARDALQKQFEDFL